MGPIDRFPTATTAEFERLVSDGLAAYRRGAVDDALVAWEDALSLRPGDRVVIGYVDYVRANYDQIHGGAAASSPELALPYELDDEGDYEISITHEALPGERLAEPAVDDGWAFEAEDTGVAVAVIELDADEPPAVDDLGFADPAVDDPAVDDLGFADPAVDDPAVDDLGFADPAVDDPAIGAPVVAGAGRVLDGAFTDGWAGPASAASGARTLTFDPADDADAGPRRGVPPGPLELDLDLDLDLGPSLTPSTQRGLDAFDFHDLEPSGEQTQERRPRAPDALALGSTRRDWPPAPLPGIGELSLDLEPVGAALELGIEAHVPGPEPLPNAPVVRFDDAPVAIEELRLPPPRSSLLVDADEPAVIVPAAPATGSIGDQLLAEIDHGRAPGLSVDEVARHRITALIERARGAAAAGDFSLAATAIDLALAESPDSAVSQKLIHRHRDAILDCYYRYFGALDLRPIAVGDMSQMGPGGLEPRAAFLMSRIDGMLTYDELLDVSGMGRLEACRHLAALIRRGLVRTA